MNRSRRGERVDHFDDPRAQGRQPARRFRLHHFADEGCSGSHCWSVETGAGYNPAQAGGRVLAPAKRRAIYRKHRGSSHTGSFSWRPSTGKIIWSEETFRIFQYDRTTIPTVELTLRRVHPEDAALVNGTIERAVEDGNDFEHEYRLLMPDGVIKHVHVVAHAVRDESRAIEFVGAVMDISDRKRAEEALRKAQAELARVNRVTTMGELTASLAHEVNQPIAAASTDANTCWRWLTRDQPDLLEAREAASRVVKDVTRAAEIVSRVRLLFKKGTAERELVDVNELIREIIVPFLEQRGNAILHILPCGRTWLQDLPQIMG